MAHVTGIGGVFIRSKGDPKALSAWYEKHLGIKIGPYGSAVLRWNEDPGSAKAATAWCVAAKDSDMFQHTESGFVINYRVVGIEELVENLRKAGARIAKDPYGDAFGKFATIVDPEGNQVELWESNK
jgi:predicted enzyme related to lactoylglutathione lyase